MKYRVEIDSNGALLIYNLERDNADIPETYQPTWPDGTEWSNEDEALAWGNAFIEVLTNPEYIKIPGNNPQQPLLDRPIIVNPEWPIVI